MKLISFFWLCLVVFCLSSCFVVPSLKDPFGTYEAKITINERNAQARETIARYDRDARLVEAEQAAAAKVDTAHAWAGMVPNVVLLLVVGVIAVMVIHWNGQITLARLAWGEPTSRSLPPHSTHQRKETPTIETLKALAKRRNQHFTVVNGVALLIDKETGEVVKRRRLLEG